MTLLAQNAGTGRTASLPDGRPNFDGRTARSSVPRTLCRQAKAPFSAPGRPPRPRRRARCVHSECATRPWSESRPHGVDGRVGTGDSGTDGSIAQNLHSLGGKVLCVTNDGSPCANNPGVVNPSFDIDDRIWSWGHRNVQGIACSPSGGGYTVEHGTDRDDEVDVLFQGNFGWNPVPGYDESQPMTGPGGIGAAWSSGLPSIAPSGATILTGGQWAGLAGGGGDRRAEGPGIARGVLRRLPRVQLDRHHLQYARRGPAPHRRRGPRRQPLCLHRQRRRH